MIRTALFFGLGVAVGYWIAKGEYQATLRRASRLVDDTVQDTAALIGFPYSDGAGAWAEHAAATPPAAPIATVGCETC